MEENIYYSNKNLLKDFQCKMLLKNHFSLIIIKNYHFYKLLILYSINYKFKAFKIIYSNEKLPNLQIIVTKLYFKNHI